MGGVGVEHPPVDQAVRDRLFDDRLEDGPGNTVLLEAAPAVLADRRGVEDPIGELQAQEPAIGDIDLDLPHQLALGADAEQIADEQRLEHQGRIQRRPAVVGAIEPGDALVDERKVDHSLDLAKQVILRNQLLERHHLERRLLRRGLLEHQFLNHKGPATARPLSAV